MEENGQSVNGSPAAAQGGIHSLGEVRDHQIRKELRDQWNSLLKGVAFLDFEAMELEKSSEYPTVFGTVHQ
ncbi:MAG: hypothetical protein H6Q00_1135 [Holophagaceae bacterium]|nr:hypothetical protein [Holophagaceae bacterium]